MLETQYYTGYWWLPKKEKKRVYGILRNLKDDGYILETIGDFKEIEDISESKNSSDYKKIYGLARSDQENKDYNFTLYNCNIIRSNIHKLNYSKISIGFFLKYPPDQIENSHFNSVSIRPLNIDKWALSKGFNDFDWEGERNFSLKYNAPNDILLYESAEVKMVIGFNVKYNYPNEHGFKMSQLGYIHITFSEVLIIEKILEFVRIVQDFLTLANNRPLFIEEYDFISLKNDQEIINRKLHYHFFQKNNLIDKRYKSEYSWRMLFTLKELQEFCPDGMHNWLKKHDNLKFTSNYLFSTIYNGYQYLENSFLDYVFALEVYHRTHYNKLELQSANYLEKRSRIIEQIENSSDKEWLKARLKEHKREPHLKLRLENLNEIFSEYYNEAITINAIFIKQIVETRHHLVHQNVKNPELVIKDGNELYYSIRKLEIMIKTILLYEIGFSKEFISKKVKSLLSWMSIF